MDIYFNKYLNINQIILTVFYYYWYNTIISFDLIYTLNKIGLIIYDIRYL